MSRQEASYDKRTQGPTYYDILGVARDAQLEEIKKKYKTLVLKFHPDREGSAIAREAMVLINNAYEVLSDSEKRMAYDASLNESPEEAPCTEEPQPKPPEPQTVRISRKVSTLIACALLVSTLAGCQMEALHGADKPASNQFVEANSHYFTATTHEALATMPLFVPGFGMTWGIVGGFTAGFVDRAAITAGSPLPVNASGLVLPYVILSVAIKLAAYHIGMVRSLKLVISIRRKRFTKAEKSLTWGDIILAVFLSSLAGFVEHAVANLA